MDVEIRYWPAGEPIPEGWVRHDGLDDTHHGAYATMIVRETISLCQCGQPLKTEDRGHHVVTTCCGQVIEGCCGDV